VKIHEFQAKKLLGEFGVPVPRGRVATTPEEARQVAEELGKPVVVHSREAKDDTVAILREMRSDYPGGVMHCFSGDYEMARACLDLGLYLSISGVVTFRNAGDLREVVEKVPVERMVIETDCPYLTPAPHRGKRNEPAFVALVAKKIAEIKKLALEDVERITTQNARRLFGMDPGVTPSITYRIRNSLYINLTNRCTLACTFCPKFADFMVKGYFLKIGAKGPAPLRCRASMRVTRRSGATSFKARPGKPAPEPTSTSQPRSSTRRLK